MPHEVLKALTTTRLRPLICLGMSLVKSVRTRRLTTIRRDGDGDWIQAHHRAAVASPDLHLKRFESVERKAERLWFHHYRPTAGDVIVDAGAGIGEDTIVFSRRLTPSGRVIAIEAHPRVYRCLEKTVRLNGLTNVTALRCALHSTDGELVISNDALHAASTVVDTSAGEHVVARSLDSIFDELLVQRVDLLKMNIEGAEAGVLEGMRSGWCAVRNVVISCHDFLAERGGSKDFRTKSRVVDLLRKRGFEILPSHADADEDWARDYVYAVARESSRF